MSYIYIQSEPSLWTVGFYDPHGKFVAQSDHDSEEGAEKQVRLLNGGSTEDMAARVSALERTASEYRLSIARAEQVKERRRYALLQAAATIQAGCQFANLAMALNDAEGLLAEIEKREKAEEQQ
jgi:hypothetical protein